MATYYPNVSMFQTLHYGLFFKFKLMDVYLFESPTFMYWGWKVVFLLNLYVFAQLTSFRFRKPLQGPFYKKWNDSVISIAFLLDHLAFVSSGYFTMESFAVHSMMVLSANIYYTELNEQRSKYNYVFYLISAHGSMLVRTLEVVTTALPDPFTGILCMYAHAVLLSRQIYYYYYVEGKHYSFNIVTAGAVDLLFFSSLQKFETASLTDAGCQLVVAFVVEQLECFGDVTPFFVQIILALHTYTVSALCNGYLKA
jgi:hypothetical protein